jgi:hypothetical protein
MLGAPGSMHLGLPSVTAVGPHGPTGQRHRAEEVTGGGSSPTVRSPISGWAPSCSPQRGELRVLADWARGAPVWAHQRRWQSCGAALGVATVPGHGKAWEGTHRFRGGAERWIRATVRGETGSRAVAGVDTSSGELGHGGPRGEKKGRGSWPLPTLRTTSTHEHGGGDVSGRWHTEPRRWRWSSWG